MKKIKVTAQRDGKTITYLTEDKGKPGKTPPGQQWYNPSVETGWRKDMGEEERRRLVLNAHKGDNLASARAMQSLANISTDRETTHKARLDASYFFTVHNYGRRMSRGRGLGKRTPRISPRVGKLR